MKQEKDNSSEEKCIISLKKNVLLCLVMLKIKIKCNLDRINEVAIIFNNSIYYK